MNLYHITKEKFLPNILVSGLKVNSKKNGFVRIDQIKSYIAKYELQPIFLTSDVEYIISNQLTNKFIKKHKMVVLDIDINGLEIEPEFAYLEFKWKLFYQTYKDMKRNISNFQNKTFISYENISPERIKSYEYIIR